MGANNSRQKAPVLTECRSPIYCVKRLGSRHLILAGGGGAAKTGVVNQIESHLLNFRNARPGSSPTLRAELASKINTDPCATMNMDVVSMQPNEAVGRYILAAGHDQYCVLYETQGYALEQSDIDGEKVLSHSFKQVNKVRTDDKTDNPYQKCVRFDKSTHGQRMVTGGSDGHLRVWNVRDLFENRSPEITHTPIHTIAAHNGDVNDIDISLDGSKIISVGIDDKVIMWDMNSSRKLLDLPYPAELEKGYRVRSVRFTPLGSKSIVFVVAYNSIQRSSKSKCFLGLFAYSPENNACRQIVLREAGAGESISSLCVSPCGHFTGIGTMAGSVGVFDTNDMRPLMFTKESHSIFVTGVEFLDKDAQDFPMALENGTPRRVPGPAAAFKASLVSLSADQSVQVHNVPYELGTPLSVYLLKIAIFSLLFHLFIWYLSGL